MIPTRISTPIITHFMAFSYVLYILLTNTFLQEVWITKEVEMFRPETSLVLWH